jgi:hypothetical protein
LPHLHPGYTALQAPTMATHKTTQGGYGPGTYTDTTFTPLPEECQRLLTYLVKVTPGFTDYKTERNEVEFVGSELPIIPGPLKAQAMV